MTIYVLLNQPKRERKCKRKERRGGERGKRRRMRGVRVGYTAAVATATAKAPSLIGLSKIGMATRYPNHAHISPPDPTDN